jgi:hypothetical protein
MYNSQTLPKPIKSSGSPGNSFMKKLFAALLLSLGFIVSYAQASIEIGKAEGDQYVITADTALLRKALQQTLGDGTQIRSMHITSVNKWHYLVATGTQRNYTKTIAVELQYNIVNRTYMAAEGLGHKTCAAAACKDCSPFTENGQIIGCRCAESRTVSNECTFKSEQVSQFYNQLSRYLKMKK